MIINTTKTQLNYKNYYDEIYKVQRVKCPRQKNKKQKKTAILLKL